MGGVVVFDFEVLQKLIFYGTFVKKGGYCSYVVYLEEYLAKVWKAVHEASGPTGWCSMKQLGVFLLSSPSQGYLRHKIFCYPIYTPRWREALCECLVQEHNTMAPARPQSLTAWFGDKHTNHEASQCLPSTNMPRFDFGQTSYIGGLCCCFQYSVACTIFDPLIWL